MRVTADQVAAAAAQEDVDVVGISILSGAHMRLMPRMVDALERHGLRRGDGAEDVMLLVGGTIPDGDVDGLRELGVDGVFPVGTFTGEMVRFIHDSLSR
jgi:methylmalonyl-CoA mutase C-terminal domain/subunit